ncbi:MAG: thiosulfate oxidation carrier protein SoxY [Magnetococcales bacterium]|nr:thiosulfate oxidation carrier protein SoxY [Magnetococcales bacterium]MBF0151183.1 thiosulfate oxidation carrier protein SoxY [Magnetococcales bacterium]MBF0174931.1 thiosulfate oxidation carrier protein SoxY [Magnetococcales bacterium]MBF0349057.1 thiosulfate oxidation carrier protein SoxY [Magnetococcales bacterium]MBF0632914.1 thiosulfate oxidation carrier protein SoxY [Magnetococcales bacterium]
MENKDILAMNRRGFFRSVGAAGIAVAVGSTMAALPGTASANIDALIAEQVGPGTITMDKITLDIPDKAENGAMVRIPIVVNHPMEPNNYIEKVAVFVDENPKPFVASYNFIPESGQVNIEFRLKMAKTSMLRVVAKSNTGSLFGFSKKIEVAEGGCAG